MLLVVGIVAIPAINACQGEKGGLVACLRDQIDRRFNLPGGMVEHTAKPPAIILPAPDLSPIAEVQAAEVVDQQTAVPDAVAHEETAAVAAVRPSVEPVAPIAPAPKPVSPVVAAGQGGPYLPPVPERVAEITMPALPPKRPAMVSRPVVAALPPTAVPSESVVESPVPAEVAAVPVAPEPAPATPAAPPVDVAAGTTSPPAPPSPSTAAPVALAPTIDAIELLGPRSVVSGSGPTGAVMRLFADDEIVGESPVEAGRWQVETGPLLTAPKRELKIEAVDPDTGRSLGETVITVEIDLPPDAPAFEPAEPATPEPPASAEPSAPKPQAALTASTEPGTVIAVPQQPRPVTVKITPPPPASKPAPVPVQPTGSVAEAEPAPPVPAAEQERKALPGLRPVTPQRESASTSILGRPDGTPSILTLD
ncbi:MAG: hypothetical protein ACO1OG_09205 [Devosia sp.]